LVESKFGVEARDAEHALWVRFKDDSDDSVQLSQVIEHYAELVPYVANVMQAKMNRMVIAGDLVSYGYEGLLQAIDRYDHTRGNIFRTFAYPRIRGAMLDGLRSDDWLPRSMRYQLKRLSSVQAAHPHATEVELAELMEVSVPSLRNIFARSVTASPLSLDEPILRVNGYDDNFGDAFDKTSTHPAQNISDYDDCELLDALSAVLTEQQLYVCRQYFSDRMTLMEIGADLGVTDSRVCQIRSGALRKLREIISRHELEAHREAAELKNIESYYFPQFCD
jgi:RNA polymerase sigma factor for flagellar operon FliA